MYVKGIFSVTLEKLMMEAYPHVVFIKLKLPLQATAQRLVGQKQMAPQRLWKTEEISLSVYLAFTPVACPITIVGWFYFTFTILSLIFCGQKILKMYCLESKCPSIMRGSPVAYLLLWGKLKAQ